MRQKNKNFTKDEIQYRDALFREGLVICSHCNKILSVSEFTKDKTTRNGLSRQCSECRREMRAKNADKAKRYREENRDRLNNYFRENRERFYLRKKAYEEAHPEATQEKRRKNRRKLSSKYRNYKLTAQRKNIPFHLDYEEFKNIISQPCQYCGTLPVDEFGNAYSGIDRIDSSKGYELSNIVPCCPMCNYMKSNTNMEDWTSKMSQILSHLESIGYISPSPNNPDELQFNDAIFEQLTNEIQKG